MPGCHFEKFFTRSDPALHFSRNFGIFYSNQTRAVLTSIITSSIPFMEFADEHQHSLIFQKNQSKRDKIREKCLQSVSYTCSTVYILTRDSVRILWVRKPILNQISSCFFFLPSNLWLVRRPYQSIRESLFLIFNNQVIRMR